MNEKKSNFSIIIWVILFSIGLGVGYFAGNIDKERSQLVQIVPSEYKTPEAVGPDFDAFKVYVTDKLNTDETSNRNDDLVSIQDEMLNDNDTKNFETKTHVQEIDIPNTELESERQFYKHQENNAFKNLRAEPPYSVPQIDEKIRSLRVKRYLPPGNKGQHNENFEAEGIVGRK